MGHLTRQTARHKRAPFPSISRAEQPWVENDRMQDALLALYASEKVEHLHPLPLSITTDKIPLAFSKIFLLVDIHREERNHLAMMEEL